MNLPITGEPALVLAVVFGALFGMLLHRGGVTNYDVIVNQFRLRDFTVMRIMLTAIIVGGIGVMVLHGFDLASYHIKSANMLGVMLGAAIFGVGMVLYGYCPGTGVAAIGTGSIHALVGAIGMLVGAALYAFSFAWVRDHILKVWALGKIRLPDVTGIPDIVWFAVLIVLALGVFLMLHRLERQPV